MGTSSATMPLFPIKLAERGLERMEPGNVAPWFGNVAQWVGAGVTFLAVVVALFKEDILRKLRHPKLTVRLEAGHPDCVRELLNEEGWHGSRYFLRLWIKNEGKVRADQVEVFLSEASEVREVGPPVAVPQFTPMNLRWSKSNPPTIYVGGISPHMGRHCDLGAISDPTRQLLLKSLPEQSEKIRLSLQLEFRPPVPQWLVPGKYKFKILVAASNCEPVAWDVDFHLTGKWSDDEKDMFVNGFLVGVRKSEKKVGWWAARFSRRGRRPTA